jgi:hypothetical protein
VVKVHAVGRHNADKSQVWLSTFRYPLAANNTYALMPEYDRTYRESGEI